MRGSLSKLSAALLLLAQATPSAALLSVVSLSAVPQTAEAAIDSTDNDYGITLGPVAGSTSANYVYGSILNPVGSGKWISISRIRIEGSASTTAAYQDLNVRRITAASAGTQVVAADIPKRNSASTNSVADVRHTNVTVTFAGTTDSRLMAVVAPAAAGHDFGKDEISLTGEKIVLSPGEGVALYQTAAGNVNQKFAFVVNWTEETVAPTAQNQFMLAWPRVEVATAADYKYGTLFNPVGSGKTIIVRRISIDADADAAAVYTNDLYLRRITAASAGTQIAVANIPKRNSSSTNSIAEVRHTNVTVTFAGTASSSIMRVTAPGAAGQAGGHMEYLFDDDEKLILQPGEGVALVGLAAGDIDQIVRLSAAWEENASTPSSEGQYIFAFPRIAAAVAANGAYASFMNPAGSGKTAVIKRLGVRVDAGAAAVYQGITWRRITAASAGLPMTASEIPKKHTGTANTVMELRALPTVTFAGTADSRLMAVTGVAAVGQTHAHYGIAFGDNEDIVLQPGEGIALYTEALGDADQYVKPYIEWDEEASVPASTGEYMLNFGPINGTVTVNYVYATLFNPSGSGKTAIIKRARIAVEAQAAAVYVPLSLRRISAASAGTQITAANVPKKHGSTTNTVMELRHTNVTATLSGSVDSRLMSVTTPGAVGAAAAVHLTGQDDTVFENREFIVLKPGEGIALYQEAAGDTDLRVKLLLEWDEETTPPDSEGEYFMSIGPVTGSTAAGYNYASIFNPVGSNEILVVRRLGIRAHRTAAQTVWPYYPNISLRLISAASGGTQIAAANIPKKHSSTTDATAEVRTTGPTVTLLQATSSRVLASSIQTSLGSVRGDIEIPIAFGRERVLYPGEGLVLVQETANGDTNTRVRFDIAWAELAVTQSAYRLFGNADSLTPGSTLALQSTAATLASGGLAFRLRMLLAVDGFKLPQNFVSYKLQYAVKSGTCDTAFSGETYADITTGTPIAYNNNASVSDGAQFAPSANDPSNSRTRIYQTYEEANSFLNASTTAIGSGQDGLWDFALYDNGAPGNTSYCIRTVEADGSLLDAYSFIPEVATAAGSNSLPVASGVSIDSGAASVTLTEGTTKTVSCVGTVTDNNGFADITSVTGDLYRTSRLISSGLDDNDHYRLTGDANCVPSGGSGNSETYTCAFAVQYFADATDAGSPNASDDWTCTLTPSDGVGAGTAASDTTEMASLYALDVTSSISYSSVSPNADTGATNQSTTVTNTGNRDMDPQVSGTNMTFGGNNIAVGQQKYSASTFTYSSGGVALSTTPTAVNLTLPQRTSAVVTASLYWGIGVPNGTPAGSYTGTNTFTATAGI